MPLQDMYPVIVTSHHKQCRDFYARWFGAVVVFEASWFVLLALPGDPPRTVAFMAPDHPSSPPGPEVFNGRVSSSPSRSRMRPLSSRGSSRGARRLSTRCETNRGVAARCGIRPAPGSMSWSKPSRRRASGIPLSRNAAG
jgi:hypothetical protein